MQDAYRYANLHATSNANSLKFNEIIDSYGPIKIVFCDYGRFGKHSLEALCSKRKDSSFGGILKITANVRQ
jgi:hypothetical protein